MAVGFGTLICFIVGIFWAWAIWHHQVHAILPTTGQGPIPQEIGKPEIGLVNQWTIENGEGSGVMVDDLKWQDEWLSSYGWSDREKGLIHIPIDEAMRRVAAKKKLWGAGCGHRIRRERIHIRPARSPRGLYVVLQRRVLNISIRKCWRSPRTNPIAPPM